MTITDLLRELGIAYTEAGNSKYVRDGWLGITCPYCNSGNAMGIALKGRAVSCWKCGSDHKLAAVLADASGQKRAAIWALLARMGLDTRKETETPLRGILCKPKGLVEGPLHRVHREYLESRGFDHVDRISEQYGLRSITIDARLAWRLWLPIICRGKVLSWTTRSTTDDGLRYVSASPEEEIVPHKRLLYNVDEAKDTIVVVEGPLDAIAIGPGAVCTFGLSFTPAQVRQMAEFPTRVVCFDSEPAAQRQASKLVDQLGSMDGRTIRVELSTGKDAASASRKEIRALRQAFLD